MSDSASPKLPGIVYTFYSYKGGVGRSMALVNVGVLMANEGYRVLLVDWDLEAPGLEVFFQKAAKLSRDPVKTPGIVDLLDAHVQGVPLPWRECLLKGEFLGKSVDILSAGRRGDDFRSRIQQLDWDALFREHRIGNFINALRNEWRADYDFVLVDSRTGITDIGDICTVILPDVLVLLFVTNYQNLQGVKGVVGRAIQARAKLPINRSKLLSVPVPARDERDRESDKFRIWRDIFAQELNELYREWLPKEVTPTDALHRIYIPYVAGWSFGECIPVLESDRDRLDPSSIGAAYARLTTLLSHRLDWSALESNATAAEIIGARAELSMARQAAHEAEARRVEEIKRREEEVRVQESKRRELEERLVEVDKDHEEKLLLEKRRAQMAEVLIAEKDQSFKQWKKRTIKLSVIGTLSIIAAAAAVYWQFGARPTATRIAALLKSDDSSVRLQAIGDLGVMIIRDKSISRFAPNVAESLNDQDPYVRDLAARLLGKMGPAGAVYAPNLVQLLRDRNPEVRTGALLGLGEFGKLVGKFSTNVVALLTDPDTDVRIAATNTLVRIGKPEASGQK